MTKKLIELPVIPRWLAKSVDQYKMFYLYIDPVNTIAKSVVINFLKIKEDHLNNECEEYQKEEAIFQYDYAKKHIDDIFIAIKYGYEVEDD